MLGVFSQGDVADLLLGLLDLLQELIALELVFEGFLFVLDELLVGLLFQFVQLLLWLPLANNMLIVPNSHILAA